METENSPPRFRSIQTHNAERTLSLPVEILEEILPVEILEEILSRLPVKSLLKFRCVSKSWRSLIDSQRFIKNHLENSTKNPTFARRRIIWKPSPQNNILKQCSLPSFLNEPFNDRFTFDDSINIQCESICLVGCCNGLVCVLLDREHFILWNPSTKMSKKLPDLDDEMKHTYITEYGFGFDEWNDDYKVFGVKFRFFHANGSQVISKLYSLKTNSWKITKNTKEFHLASGAKFASGKLHWEKIWGPNWDIVYFDLKSEVYGKVEQPCYSEGVFNPSLGVIGGCLCVLCDYSETHFDLWVMKHYGVKESWDKVMTLANLHDPPGVRFFSPLCIGPSGEILLIYGWTFMIYYPKDNVFRHPLTIELDSFHEADVFVESLVPLVPDVEP